MPNPRTIAAIAALMLISILSVFAGDMFSTLHSTLIASPTGSVRYVGHFVGRVHWIDCRNISPPGSTVTVSRIYSEGPGTDTVATVICSNGLGRSAPSTNTWFAILGEYFAVSGCDTCSVRVITSGVP